MLQCLRLSVFFDDTVALDAVNLTVRDGEVVAVMGQSGCGKTTLLRSVAGLQLLDIGSVEWDQQNLRGVPPHERGFGLMFQDYALFPHLNVGENVQFGLRMQGMTTVEQRARAAEVLELVGLKEYTRRPVHELSGGEQQRVALARTLAPAPRLILLDEPIGALDRTLRERLIGEMRDIFSTLGVTALYVTHDRDEAFAVADTVAVMSHGRFVRKGTPEEVWNDPQDEFVASILGFNTILDATVHDGWADLGWARVASRLPVGKHRIILPPQAVRIHEAGAIHGFVASATYRAGVFDLEVRVGGTLIEAETPLRIEPGAAIRFDIDAERLMAIAD